MAYSESLSPLTPAEAAEAVGVGVQSIRRWCEWHAMHLSAGASPGSGVPRRLVARDVEVLKVVKELRYQGLQTEAINERLKTMAFPDIADSIESDNAVTVADSADTLPVVQETSSAVQLPIVALNDLRSEFNAKFTALEQRTRPNVWWFVAGLVAGLGFAAVAELFALVARR